MENLYLTPPSPAFKDQVLSYKDAFFPGTPLWGQPLRKDRFL
ncbi:hypothetical protein ABID29_002474 [Streptococcus rupicaprae]|uniref:Uncharacterized protein n=1 Tax=Streptococcus rupicaprae TaxID=759619 RepID=A0ABV2FL83_9STRE